VTLFRVRKEIPWVWSVQIGDILHNLRAALDNAIFEASARQSGKPPPPQVEYPIFLDQTKFLSTKTGGDAYKMRALQPETQQLITKFQPFRYEDPLHHYLWMLHCLNNIDKHRLLAITTLWSQFTGMTQFPGIPIERYWMQEPRPGEKETEIMRVRLVRPAPPGEDVRTSGSLRFIRHELVFDESMQPAAELPVRRVIDGAGRVVSAIVREIARLTDAPRPSGSDRA
jgi:hypothetical protein